MFEVINGDVVAPTGVFYDTKNGVVVTEPPEEGIQIVAPGSEVTPADKAALHGYGVEVNTTVTVELTDDAVVDDDIAQAIDDEVPASKPSRSRK